MVSLDNWQQYGLATIIRERLSLVAGVVPEVQSEAYLSRFRERAWDLFREWLYDAVPAESGEEAESDVFSFDLADESAPHNPFPIYWNRGLAALSSLRALEGSVVSLAYGPFLERFDSLFQTLWEEPR